MVRRSNWLPLGCPSELLLPGRSPEFAALFEVVSLRELFSTDVAGHKGVAVLVDAIGEVLTGHADHTPFPALEFMRVDNVPVLHMFFASTYVLDQVWVGWQGLACESSCGCLGGCS